jgi:hypothetical protein
MSWKTKYDHVLQTVQNYIWIFFMATGFAVFSVSETVIEESSKPSVFKTNTSWQYIAFQCENFKVYYTTWLHFQKYQVLKIMDKRQVKQLNIKYTKPTEMPSIEHNNFSILFILLTIHRQPHKLYIYSSPNLSYNTINPTYPCSCILMQCYWRVLQQSREWFLRSQKCACW